MRSARIRTERRLTTLKEVSRSVTSNHTYVLQAKLRKSDSREVLGLAYHDILNFGKCQSETSPKLYNEFHAAQAVSIAPGSPFFLARRPKQRRSVPCR